MNGEALITIKDKNGKIKQQVKEKNLVFDLPKLMTKEIIQEADLGLGSTGGYSDYSNANNTCALAPITAFEEWFRSIKINDVTCDTTDFKDWKLPILWGGEVSKSQTGNDRYAYYDINNSSKQGNVLKKSYTWINCPAFTIRSINLGHYSIQGSAYRTSFLGIFGNSTGAICKYGKFYWLEQGYNQNANYKGVYYNRLYTKGSFSWELERGRKAFTKEISNYKGWNYSDYYYYNSSIFALKNNEIAIFRWSDDITTDDENQSYVRYLYIIDATTGNVKRSFPLTQFNGFIGGSGGKQQWWYAKIIATDFGSFLVSSKNESTSNLFIWKIPEQSEMTNYSNNESIPEYADISSTGIHLGYGSFCLNEYIFSITGSYTTSKTLKINNDTQNPYTVYDYIPFNISTGYSSSTNQCGVTNKYYTKVIMDGGGSIAKWYNTTVLNLSEGVEVTQGDTVTIEYTITAS